jgi:hypothetical protein
LANLVARQEADGRLISMARAMEDVEVLPGFRSPALLSNRGRGHGLGARGAGSQLVDSR